MAPLKAVLYTGIAGLFTITASAQDVNQPPDAKPGACYIHYTAPALIETVTEQVLIKPEKRILNIETGETTVVSPAVYRTETLQKIIRDRHDGWAEIICDKDQTIVFIETLQRALFARGYYRGPITGVKDDRTNRAIRKVQKRQGINATEVTLDLAESYGLVTHRIFLK